MLVICVLLFKIGCHGWGCVGHGDRGCIPCRQAVTAVLFRHAASRPQRVLQAFRQGHEALAAQQDMGMLEAREWRAEVVERWSNGSPSSPR
jgi:hypothetical protein